MITNYPRQNPVPQSGPILSKSKMFADVGTARDMSTNSEPSENYRYYARRILDERYLLPAPSRFTSLVLRNRNLSLGHILNEWTDELGGQCTDIQSLQQLLPELLDMIFRFLPRKSLFSIALTSKYLFIHAIRHLYRNPPLKSCLNFNQFVSRLGQPYVSHVRVIDLSSLPPLPIVTDTILMAIAKATGVRLQELNLSGCSKVGFEGLVSVAMNCPNLETLVLSGITLNDSELSFILARLPRLRRLHLNLMPEITDFGVFPIAHRLRYLEDLSLSFMKGLTAKSVEALATEHLQTLQLRACGKFSSSNLIRLSELSPNLQTLGLDYNGASASLTREALFSIIPTFKHLKYLRVLQPLIIFGGRCERRKCMDERDVGRLYKLCRGLEMFEQDFEEDIPE